MTSKPAHELLPLTKTRPVDSESAAVRTQLALIRSISDELERTPSGSAMAYALEAQLDEEMSRLDRIAQDMPRSGAHTIKLPQAG